jgi:histone H3/H4
MYFRINKSALLALQEAAEAYLVGYFEDVCHSCQPSNNYGKRF